ncbi:uncharacterized protein L201_006300 [Kwoniella dendrophila CBS 6074]|uniref:ZZ-type domain-containing protein n=1 Tax=Kwoniella dendrophila CBS 6074 TaxID=1295534 RepID=A0AAX4K1D3_9TREE
MYPSSSRSIPDRPSRALVVKCAYDGTTRRITFPSAGTCRLDSLRTRVEECFNLSASPFSLAYTDDDGEEFSLRTETDLTEAIGYFVSGDDDAAMSNHSGSSSGQMMYPFSARKITIRLDVLVEYDGPSLSDTSSVSSFRTSTGSLLESERDGKTSQGSWSSDNYEESLTSRRSSSGFGTLRQNSEPVSVAGRRTSTIQQMSSLDLNDKNRYAPRSDTVTPKNVSIHSSGSSNKTSQPHLPPILTGPESDPAPSLLTHTDLGTRWLREQSSLAARKLGPAPRQRAKRSSYDSDEDSYGSDEESPGDIALVRDARGRYYYSYQTDASSHSSHSEADHNEYGAGPSHRLSGFHSEITLSTSPPKTPHPSELPFEPVRIAEPTGPPILAPDCSACGIRLDYMRYVCQTCGEGDFWKEDALGKAAFIPPRLPSETDLSDGSSSEVTEWAAGPQTVYNLGNPRTRSSSSSTDDSSGSLQANFGGQSSPTTATYRYGNGPTLPDSPTSSNEDLISNRSIKLRGYELCAGCIEVHGIAHTKSAAQLARQELIHFERRRRRQTGDSRHTFREKIWAAEGWVDLDYSEEMECTICHNLLYRNRYKCVSCSNFNLCQTCYHKVAEIHPAHAFLSLPDKEIPTVNSLQLDAEGGSISNRAHVIPVPMRHPGAFCHNCLQDIVGPRFHCAVCAVDLCIQCEAVVMEVNGTSHTADHIMMKIPVPISSHEVDAVSRRARDRWFQQDRTVTASISSPFVGDGETSSRSSSPTNDTVYAPTTSRHRDVAAPPPQQIINVTSRDALDHNLKCGNCTEWIMGRRFQCANCPSDPEGYNLCSICELRSYKIHNPSHIFLKFDRPVHIPVRSSRPILPLLYRQPVGKVPTSALATINPRDPTAYLQHLLHRETLCDVHGDQIRGTWLRCCHCAAGFDVCQEAERVLDHDPTHVFVLFKSRVDMSVFRALADLSAIQSKPLLKQQVYLS